MILAPHAIAGAALASLTPNQPLIGFAAGFLSHFVLDAIPHWDYTLISMKEDRNNPMNNDMALNKKFLIDILKISLDASIGILISYLIFYFYLDYSPLAILFGAAGGLAPDALQFAYMKWKHEPLTSLQKFHLWIHAEKNRNKK